MSASLVGSEMCIRDSPLGRHARSTNASLSSCSTQKSRRSEARPKKPAVSYTHLTLPTICSV
eukprot:13854739-Alexandrium_andersonii.AAC.1